MANNKITDLLSITSLSDDDLFVVVNDPTGTPVTNKITVANAFLGKLSNVVEDTTPQLGGDLDANGNQIFLTDTQGIVFNPSTGDGQAFILTDDANFAKGELIIHRTNASNLADDAVINFTKGFGIYSDTELDGSGSTYAPYVASQSGKLRLAGDEGGVLIETYSGTNTDITLTPDGTGKVLTSKIIENTTSGEGIILKSPDGTRYKLTVANGGTLAIAAA